MARSSEAVDDVIAAVWQYDPLLARIMESEERAHQVAQTHPNSVAARVTYLTDIGLPGRFQTPKYAEHLIRQALPKIGDEEVAQRVQHRMWRKNRYTEGEGEADPVRVFLTESALGRDIPEATTALRGLAQRARSDNSNLQVRIVPDEALVSDPALRSLRNGNLIMPGAREYYCEPEPFVADLIEARQMVAAAVRFHALTEQESLARIDLQIQIGAQ